MGNQLITRQRVVVINKAIATAVLYWVEISLISRSYLADTRSL